MRALDIGGTHVSAARVDVRTSAVEAGSRVRVPLPPGADRAQLLARIVRAAADTGAPAGATGVAVPGPFDYARGVSAVSHKLEPLYGVDLRHELAAGLGHGAPEAIVFLNDADAFLLGEWWAGAARGHARVVGVTLGSGLGSAFLERGRIVDTGDHVPPEGSLHLVSYRGAPAEDTISRRGLLARYGDDGGLDVHDVAKRARAGDTAAQRAFAEVATALAEHVLPWLESFDASCLVVGGSIAHAWDLLEPSLHRGLGSFPVEATVATEIDDAPLLGAALRAAEARL